MSRRKLRLSGWAVLVVLAMAFPVRAQNNDELNAGIEFNFSNPGARSLAMAGAFTALGDDATAAYANPAGLMILAKPEVAGELRRFSFEIPYADRGHPIGTPTQQGLDTVEGIRTRAPQTSANALSFLSFSYPSDRWAFAIYRHQVAKFRTSVNSTAIFLTDEESGFVSRLFPTQGELNIDIINYGVSAAFKVGDNLLVGGGLSYYLGSIEGVQRRYSHGIPGNGGTNPGQDFGPPLYTQANLVNYTVERGNSADVGFNAGLIFKPSDAWSVGWVYRRGPSFPVQAARYIVGADRSSTLYNSTTNPFHVPDVFAVGIAYRPMPGLVISFDADHVRYSQLVQDIGDLQNSRDVVDPQFLKYTVDDGIEARIGGEYVFRRAVPFAVRLGAWSDPDHRIRYEAAPITSGDAQVFSSIAFQRGKNQIHVTGGAGVVFSSMGQLDLGIDLAGHTKTIALSFLTRFGS